MAKPTLSVVVVSYRTPDLLEACLAALSLVTVAHEVVVVDNASDDGSAQRVANRFPDARLICNPVNVGFARAVNQALDVVQGRYTLLLNPDTTVPQGALESLLELIECDAAIAAVGPAIDHVGGRRRVLDAGRQLTTWRLFAHASGLSRLSKRWRFLEGAYLLRGIHDDRARDVDWTSGACFLARTSVLTSLTGMSERWFMYAEDFELCLRIRNAGWRIVHDPSVRISHHLGASWSDGGARRRSGKVAWALAWTDYHRTCLARSATSSKIWRAVFVAQLLSRAAHYTVKARRDVTRAAQWRAEAADFRACAAAVLRFRAAPAGAPAAVPAATPAGRVG